MKIKQTVYQETICGVPTTGDEDMMKVAEGPPIWPGSNPVLRKRISTNRVPEPSFAQTLLVYRMWTKR